MTAETGPFRYPESLEAYFENAEVRFPVDQLLAIGFVLFHIVRHLTYSAATLVDAMAFIALCIASAASRPSLIAQTTSEAPRTISPAA